MVYIDARRLILRRGLFRANVLVKCMSRRLELYNAYIPNFHSLFPFRIIPLGSNRNSIGTRRSPLYPLQRAVMPRPPHLIGLGLMKSIQNLSNLWIIWESFSHLYLFQMHRLPLTQRSEAGRSTRSEELVTISLLLEDMDRTAITQVIQVSYFMNLILVRLFISHQMQGCTNNILQGQITIIHKCQEVSYINNYCFPTLSCSMDTICIPKGSQTEVF